MVEGHAVGVQGQPASRRRVRLAVVGLLSVTELNRFVRVVCVPLVDNGEGGDGVGIADEIHEANTQFQEAIRAADSQTMPSLYTSDANDVLVLPTYEGVQMRPSQA